MVKMIKINDIEFEIEENMTVDKLIKVIEGRKDILPITGQVNIVFVNNDQIRQDKFKTIVVKNGDNIKIIPLLGGG